MAKIKICKEPGCNNAQTTQGFCRFHYLKNWKNLKIAKEKDAAKRLNKYVEAIVTKYPDRYIEVIKKELKSRHFEKTVADDYKAGELDDVFKIFNEPDYEEEVEKLIRDLKIENKF